MKLKLIWTDSIAFFLTNLPQIAALCLPWLVAGAVVEFLIVTTPTEPAGQPKFFWALAFNMLVLPIYTAALILLMAKRAQNQHPSNRELLMAALRVWQPFFLLHLLGSALVGFGFMLFILPGLWALARLAFAEFYLVLEGIHPFEAIQKSFHATRPHTRIILSLVLVYVVPVLAMMLFSSGLPPENNFGYALSAMIRTGTSFLLLFVNVLLFRVYMDTVQGNRPGTA